MALHRQCTWYLAYSLQAAFCCLQSAVCNLLVTNAASYGLLIQFNMSYGTSWFLCASFTDVQDSHAGHIVLQAVLCSNGFQMYETIAQATIHVCHISFAHVPELLMWCRMF